MVFNLALASRTQMACRTILVLTIRAVPPDFLPPSQASGTCTVHVNARLVAHGALQLVRLLRRSICIVTHRKTSPYTYYYSNAGTIRLVLMCC